MVRLEQADHGRGARGQAACLLGRGDLVADVGTRGRTRALASAVRAEEHPSVAREDRTERVERLPAEHAGCAAMVVHDRGKRSLSLRLVYHAVKRQFSAAKCHGLRPDVGLRANQEEQREGIDSYTT